MSVQLSNLVPAVKAQMNPLGGTPVITDDDEEDVVRSLMSAFWTAKAVGGWFPNHRVNLDGDAIVAVQDGVDDLSREEQQIVVLFAVLTSWKAQLISQPTNRRVKAASGAEVERSYSSTVLRSLIESAEAQLADLVDQLRKEGRDSAIGFIDLGANAADGSGRIAWVR